MNPTLNTSDIFGLSDQHLKQELTHRGLPAHGLRPVLVERLQQAIDSSLRMAQQLASATMLDEMQRMLNAGDVESIRLWLEAGVDVDIAKKNGCTPLFVACAIGHVALVRLLLDAGADKEKVKKDGFNPLFVACQEGHEEVVRMLLGEGADKEKASNTGATPLLIACGKGHTAVVKLLLDEGASITVEVIIQGRKLTSLYMACNEGHDAIVRLLLQYGVKSIDEDEVEFRPAANAVLRQWNALSPARQEIVRRYDWSFVDLPAEWTVRHHHQYPAEFRQQVTAAALTLRGPLGALGRKPGDLMHRMAEELHVLMGFGADM